MARGKGSGLSWGDGGLASGNSKEEKHPDWEGGGGEPQAQPSLAVAWLEIALRPVDPGPGPQGAANPHNGPGSGAAAGWANAP